MCIAGLEKLTSANWSVSPVNDRLFPIELTEIADWTSMSEYMLHSNFGQTLTRVISGNFGAHSFILRLSLFPKYLSTFLDILSTESIRKQNKNTFHEQTKVDFDKPSRVVLFEFSQRSSAKCRG